MFYAWSKATNLLSIPFLSLHPEFPVFQVACNPEKVHNSAASLFEQGSLRISISHSHIIMSDCHVAGSVAAASVREDAGSRIRKILNK